MTDYIPFGDEWKAELNKWRKADLIDFLRINLIEKKDLNSTIAFQTARIKMLEQQIQNVR